MKTGLLKKLNLKGCSIATRKEFAEDLRATTTMDQLTSGYVKYAQKRDNYGMKRDGIIRRDQDQSFYVQVGGKQCETDQSDELEIVQKRHRNLIEEAKQLGIKLSPHDLISF